MAPLPVRDLADVPLADLFDAPGCPLCRRAATATARLIEAILTENVNDVGFRAELDRARGLCPAHVHALLAINRARTGGSLSSAILYAAILRVRRRELEAAAGARGRGRGRRVEEAHRPAACPVCRHAETVVRGSAESLVRLTAEPAWAEAVGSAGFCLDHTAALMAVGHAPAPWPAVEARLVARLAGLQAALDGFAHHASEDRRHLLTDEERDAVDAGARALGGEPGPST